MDYLTDGEKEKIINFNADEVLVEAIRKVMLASIYSNGTLRKGKSSEPLKNAALGLAFLANSGQGVVSNEDLGEDLRGLAQGVNLLEQGFKQLATIKKKDEDESAESEINEAI